MPLVADPPSAPIARTFRTRLPVIASAVGPCPPLFGALQSADAPTSIQMTSAMVMQLVQVVAELPAVDAGSQAAEMCVNTSIGWSDYFWSEVFKK